MRELWAHRDSRIAILVGLSVALLNVLLILNEQFWALLLPLGLLLIALALLALDKLLLFVIFSTPLSIFYFHPDLHIGFTLPTEPLLFGIMLLFFAKLLYRGDFDARLVRHPLSLALIFNLLWLGITSLTSELPLVSLKFFLARLWFVVVGFYLFAQLFKRERDLQRFFWLYGLPLAGVVLYTLYIHSQHGFSRQTSVWVMFPFYKEHTVYGAALALFIPAFFFLSFSLKMSLGRRLTAFLIFSILMLGVVFSFTRAAWVSLAAAAVVGLLLWWHVRRDVFMGLVALFIGTLFYFQADLVDRFSQNQATSSTDNLTEHVSSISNISTDASNMERVNRWKAALRMFEERPLLGFGPGTYMFLYAPYQKPHEKTIISTNAGDLGNAHSEYIGPLAESGILGLLSVLAIVLTTAITGTRVYYRLQEHNHKMLALAALLGLTTYWTHAFLNNFLDMDKTALPVFGLSAMLAVFEVYYCPANSAAPPDKAEEA